MEYFLEQIRIALAKRKKVLFLDIGANVGLYTIGLTNRIGKKRFTTYAFEPDPVYHKLLLHNIAENDIKDVVVHNVAVGNVYITIETDGFRLVKDKVEKTRVRFRIRTLDSIITPSVLRRFDQIFVKIDIEGHEEEALRGSVQLFRSGKPMLFMIEDCVNPSIQTYLKTQKFTFRGKITPYNSFWEV
jgi:FkbM family methyltransferase